MQLSVVVHTFDSNIQEGRHWWISKASLVYRVIFKTARTDPHPSQKKSTSNVSELNITNMSPAAKCLRLKLLL